jgi:aminoglycoside phosphotransferase (APT) family kinase protein
MFPDHVHPALVAEAVSHARGIRPDRLVKCQQNRRRATYEAHFPDGTFFFKIEISIPYGFPSLALEKWALDQAAELGLAVPQPVALDCSESLFPFRWLLLPALPGVCLTDSSVAPDTQAAFIHQAGEILYRLHQIRIVGFGSLQDDYYLRTGRVRGEADDWRSFMVRSGCDHAEQLTRFGVLSASEKERVMSFIEACVPDLENGHLLHGDVQPKHIFVDPSTGKLTGILDFGDRQSGDPEWELSWVLLQESWRPPVEDGFISSLLEGYRGAGGSLNMDTLNCYLAIRLLWMIRRRVELDRRPVSDITPLKDRLLSLLPA